LPAHAAEHWLPQDSQPQSFGEWHFGVTER